ncbi:MAG: hypothetical protein J7M03_01385 [Candidatus Desulfofervidaceae bacterium]|nr:hypothetical protein [Candidatus Desulfofervidaceae bacterium]MDL1969590.1 hypothetical protein [Candidatus Desulfofervidaceae bacterium]
MHKQYVFLKCLFCVFFLLTVSGLVYAEGARFQCKVYDAQGQFLGYLVDLKGEEFPHQIDWVTVYRPDINRFLSFDTLTGDLVPEVKIWFNDVKCESEPYIDWQGRFFVYKHTYGKKGVKYYTTDSWPPLPIASFSLFSEGKKECSRISISTKKRLPAKEITLPIRLPAATPFVFK